MIMGSAEAEMPRKTDTGADYTDVAFSRGYKGAMTPTSDGTSHIRAVLRGPKR